MNEESAERRARYGKAGRPLLSRLTGNGEPMPRRFERLAVYNAERARGIMHTPEWDAQMAELQAAFDAWAAT